MISNSSFLTNNLQRIPALADVVHGEMRILAQKAHTNEEKKYCKQLYPLTLHAAPYCEAGDLRLDTQLRYQALENKHSKRKTFPYLLHKISNGCLGSIVPKITSNPSLLTKGKNNHTIVDTLLAFISSKNDYWRNSKTPYAKAEKDYASQILNTCFNQPILLHNKYNHLKQKWALKVDSIPGLLERTELPFYVRVIRFSMPLLLNTNEPTFQITEAPANIDDIVQIDIDPIPFTPPSLPHHDPFIVEEIDLNSLPLTDDIFYEIDLD